MYRFIKTNWPGISWAIIILLLSGLPGNYFPRVSTFWDWLAPDKLVHVFMFAVFTFAILWGNRRQYKQPGKRSVIVVVSLAVGISFGALTEYLQDVVFIGRHGNVYDFYANTAGSILGVLVFDKLFRKK